MPAPYTPRTTGTSLVHELSSHIQNKVILTTGVSPGSLGAFFVSTIAAASPSLLILAGRDPAKLQQTASDLAKSHPGVKTRILRLDLGSLQAVREAAVEVNSWGDVPAIDVVVNNAGIMGVEYGLTVDGFERHFGTNHLGHWLFTNLIMGKVLKAREPRVVSVSSSGHRVSPVRWDDLDFHVSSPLARVSIHGVGGNGADKMSA
jgi:NAD(P)-dependent dehydrogenase (short-subunit alcohol dehydrogenase family)